MAGLDKDRLSGNIGPILEPLLQKAILNMSVIADPTKKFSDCMNPAMQAQLETFCSAIANSVATAVADATIDELKTYGEVTITVAEHIHTGGTLLPLGVTGPPTPAVKEIGIPNIVPALSTGGIT